MVTLSFRPQGAFAGTPGQEQFFIEKEGEVAHRQVLSLPERGRGRRFPMIPIAIGFAAVVIAAVAFVVFVGDRSRSGGGDENPATGLVATSAPAPTITASPVALVSMAVTTPTLVPTLDSTPAPPITEVPVEVIKEVRAEKGVEEVLIAPGTTAKETIVFADQEWDTAQIQNAIARRIIEDGYGYPTDAIFGGAGALWPRLVGGDVDVNMEIWLPNQQGVWESAVAKGEVTPLGKSLDDNWQSAYVVPSYLVEQNPGLKTVQDIRDYVDIFPREEGKAVLVNCIAEWRCLGINESQLKSYGLDDIITLQDPGSRASLFTSLEGAYAKGEPWLGYLWGPTQLAAELDLTLLEEPECTESAGPETGCGYPISNVRIAVHPTLVPRAPEVIEFLRKWDFTAAIDVAANAYKRETDATFDEVATWFPKNHGAAWTRWVPADVTQKVKDALAQES